MLDFVGKVTIIYKKTMTNKTNSTYSKDEAYSIKIGMYAILIIAILFATYIIRRDLTANQEKSSYYSINARFGRTDGLSIGNDVRLAGVNVGKGSDDTLFALVDGKVKFETKRNNKKQVSVYAG